MSLQALTYVVVGLSFALYIGIAFWSRALNTGDFYIAGRGVSPLANGMATAADWMSAASFISMAGLIAFLGYDGSVYLMGWTGGYVLLALLLAPYLRKFGKFTVPEFIGERYYSKTARIVAVICLIFISFTYVAGQMRGVGIVFSRFLEVDVTVGLVIGMGIVFIYAVLGGMKGITYTQVAQYCVLIFAYTVPAIFIAIQITGNPVPQLAFGSEVVGSGTALLDKLDDIVTSLGFNQYTSGTKSKIDIMCITLALMVGTAGLPHVIVRFFTVPKVRDIGSRARHVARDQAYECVAGYTCFMDGTVRDWQRHTAQFTPGKNFHQSGAVGPTLTTPDEVPDPASLSLTTRVNGQLMQQGSLDELIFDIPALIEYCSTFVELLPGDIISTGTPGGVGAARQPPLWLRAGDIVAVDIGEIGCLQNRVRDE